MSDELHVCALYRCVRQTRDETVLNDVMHCFDPGYSGIRLPGVLCDRATADMDRYVPLAMDSAGCVANWRPDGAVLRR